MEFTTKDKQSRTKFLAAAAVLAMVVCALAFVMPATDADEGFTSVNASELKASEGVITLDKNYEVTGGTITNPVVLDGHTLKITGNVTVDIDFNKVGQTVFTFNTTGSKLVVASSGNLRIDTDNADGFVSDADNANHVFMNTSGQGFQTGESHVLVDGGNLTVNQTDAVKGVMANQISFGVTGGNLDLNGNGLAVCVIDQSGGSVDIDLKEGRASAYVNVAGGSFGISGTNGEKPIFTPYALAVGEKANLTVDGKMNVYSKENPAASGIPSGLKIKTVSNAGTVTVTEKGSIEVPSASTFTNAETATINVLGAVTGTIANQGYIALGPDADVSGATVSGNQPQVTPDRPIGNVIPLGNATIDGSDSSINADANTEVQISGNVVVSGDGFMNIKGKLTVLDGGSLTIQNGGYVNILAGGIVDIQGDLYAEAGSEEQPAFLYLGSSMTVSGSVSLDGAYSFDTSSKDGGNTTTGENIVISGYFVVGEDATAKLVNVTVAQDGELEINGVLESGSVILNEGTVTIDYQGIGEGSDNTKDKTVDVTVKLGATGTVDVRNLYGIATIQDSDLTVDGASVKYANSVVLKDVSGAVVSERIEVVDESDGKVAYNSMLVSGTITAADTWNSVEPTGFGAKVTVDGTSSDVIIDQPTEIGENVILQINGNATVASDLTVTAANNAVIVGVQNGATGDLTVTGKAVVKGSINLAKGTVNAAVYNDGDNKVYTTLETALDDNKDKDANIDLLGANEVTGEAVIPVGTKVTMTEKSTLTVADGATLTVQAAEKKSGTLNMNASDVYVYVDGTMELQNKDKSRTDEKKIVSDTYKDVDGARTYTNIYNALDQANENETVQVSRISVSSSDNTITLTKDVQVKNGVTLLIPEGQKVAVDNGVTVTVDGTLRITGTGSYTMKDAVKDDNKAAGATVVNGMLQYTDDAYTDTFSSKIVGAYFTMDVDKNEMNVIAPLASVPAISNDVTSETVALYGDMDLGDIDFSAYTGEGLTVVAYNNLTVDSLTLGNAAFTAGENSAVNGTIVLANGSVELRNVTGITAKNTVTDETTTSVIGGAVKAAPSEEKDVTATGSISITGTIVSEVASVAEDTPVTVPAGATLVAVSGTVADMSVAGTLTVGGQNVTITTLAVTGTVNVTEGQQYAATVTTLYAGVSVEKVKVDEKDKVVISDLGASASISGVKLAEAGTAYIAPSATIGEDVIASAKKTTAYYVDKDLFVTAYTNGEKPISDILYKIENARFDGWVYDDNGTMKPVEDATNNVNLKIGDKTEVYASIEYNVFNVTVYGDAGIGSVSIDGNVLINKNGNAYETTAPIAAGTHTITYTLKSGYTGEATLTVSGDNASISGMNFTLSGTPVKGVNNGMIDITLSLAGTTPSQSTVVVNNGGDDGLGLTDYLLIILVVLIVIMAIIVAMRLMRS